MGQVTDYPVFMAIAEAVGHDRRGNEVYIRDPDGAEKIFEKEQTVLRRRANRHIPITRTVREKEVDDDLPPIGRAYREFVETGQVPA